MGSLRLGRGQRGGRRQPPSASTERTRAHSGDRSSSPPYACVLGCPRRPSPNLPIPSPRRTPFSAHTDERQPVFGSSEPSDGCRRRGLGRPLGHCGGIPHPSQVLRPARVGCLPCRASRILARDFRLARRDCRSARTARCLAARAPSGRRSLASGRFSEHAYLPAASGFGSRRARSARSRSRIPQPAPGVAARGRVRSVGASASDPSGQLAHAPSSEGDGSEQATRTGRGKTQRPSKRRSPRFRRTAPCAVRRRRERLLQPRLRGGRRRARRRHTRKRSRRLRPRACRRKAPSSRPCSVSHSGSRRGSRGPASSRRPTRSPDRRTQLRVRRQSYIGSARHRRSCRARSRVHGRSVGRGSFLRSPRRLRPSRAPKGPRREPRTLLALRRGTASQRIRKPGSDGREAYHAGVLGAEVSSREPPTHRLLVVGHCWRPRRLGLGAQHRGFGSSRLGGRGWRTGLHRRGSLAPWAGADVGGRPALPLVRRPPTLGGLRTRTCAIPVGQRRPCRGSRSSTSGTSGVAASAASSAHHRPLTTRARLPPEAPPTPRASIRRHGRRGAQVPSRLSRSRSGAEGRSSRPRLPRSQQFCAASANSSVIR